MTKNGARRGRPALPVEKRKAANLTFRTRPGLREWLGEAANVSGRSLSEEVEHRIERTVQLDEWLGGPAATHMLTIMGSVMRLIRQHARARGWDEKQCREAIRAAIAQVADVHLATKPIELPDTMFLLFGPVPPMPPKKAGAMIAADTMQFRQDERLEELRELAGTDLAKRWS